MEEPDNHDELDLKNEADLKRFMDIQRIKFKPAALRFMREKTRSLEVVRQDEVLERVYFLTVPYFEAINDNIKDEFNQEVCRVSCKTKCNDLIEIKDELLYKLKRERQIVKHRLLRFVREFYNQIKSLSYFFVMMINLLSLVMYKQGKLADEDIEPVDMT